MVFDYTALSDFYKFREEITSSSGRKYKQEVLQRWKNNENILKLLQINFDPYRVYGISKKKLEKQVAAAESCSFKDVFELFEYLEKNNTGRDIDLAQVNAVINQLAFNNLPHYVALLLELIAKDVTLGVDTKTINSVIPNLINSFQVQLAEKYFENPQKIEGREFTITTKIDGCRIIAIKENNQVSFYTRAGQVYEGLVDLEQEMLEKLPDNICLDGELTLLDATGKTSGEAYKETIKLSRKDGIKHQLKMLVFDCMAANEFRTQATTKPYAARRAQLDILFRDSSKFTYFEVLPVLYTGSDTSKIQEYLDAALADKQEGIMLNLNDAPYRFKRSWDIQKVKLMHTLDLEVAGYEEGEGRLSGTLGALVVRYKNGNKVKVGSGFSDEQRSDIWRRRDIDIIGAVIECSYFEECQKTTGLKDGEPAESLRFPVFRGFRYDKLTPDF